MEGLKEPAFTASHTTALTTGSAATGTSADTVATTSERARTRTGEQAIGNLLRVIGVLTVRAKIVDFQGTCLQAAQIGDLKNVFFHN